MRYAKYHALGNDYVVIDPRDLAAPLTAAQITAICHRHFGIGSDGVLLGPLSAEASRFALRIFNPDGSEAEKSGNGLRIFSRFLWDRGQVEDEEFAIQTAGGKVKAVVKEGGRIVTVEMGRVSFWSDDIPVLGPRREVLRERIRVGGRTFNFCAATVGNPHCVLVLSEVSPVLARRFGPLLEVHPTFPRRTNVQFMKVIDRRHLQLEIWERGAGYTLASGTSSAAAAAVARRLGLCAPKVAVRMPGGRLDIEVGADFSIRMTGPVAKVAEGTIAGEVFQSRPPTGLRRQGSAQARWHRGQ